MLINPKTPDWHQSHDVLMDIVAPRSIALVSTVGKDGIRNVAPYSLFCPMCFTPMFVGFAVGRKKNAQKKDTL